MTGLQFFVEFLGTAMLLLLGGGVVANNILNHNKGFGTGFLHVNFGWGIAVLAGALVAGKSGAHLNPALTIGMFFDPAVHQFAPGIDKTGGNLFLYLVAQFLGAFVGAVLCWLAYKQQFDAEETPANKLGVFSTGPEMRSPLWNVITEILATFVLVIVILSLPETAAGFGPLLVALTVVGIGASLGGPTGYAINPARDLSPRIAHAILPIKGKGDSDWGYAWIPVVGPIVGGVIAGLVHAFITTLS
jgi:glycerol uptake facilitator protein